jgi:pyridinium-3,5-bisthiocarboxylic acid mononucleotide nickel chelatase
MTPRTLYIDVVGGAAGDMLLAALLGAGASLPAVHEAIEAVVPGRFVIRTEPVRRGGLRALLLVVRDGVAHSGAGLAPRPLRELLAAVDGASLKDGVRASARRVLERLGWAEARVHGLQQEGVALDELGDEDTLLDVVGIAAALDALGIERILVSPIPLGAGAMLVGDGGHPALPLPAPATVELLHGFAVRGARAEETVTPTAAAVFAALGEPADALPSMRIEAAGYGAGTRDPEGVPNVVRVLIGTEARIPGEPTEDGSARRDLLVLEANLDDLAPELVADAAEALRRAGALDAWVTPATMKKGRPGFVLSALCEPPVEPRMLDVFFEETTTFGVRSYPVRRAELRREIVTVELPEGTVRVKAGWWGGRVVTATPEHDDVAEVARRAGRPVRAVYEEAAAAARELRFQRTGP